jgi:hypothetical protein
VIEPEEDVYRAALGIELWKQSIFERLLNEAEISWTLGSSDPHMVLLQIETIDAELLTRVIHIANAECARNKKNLHH